MKRGGTTMNKKMAQFWIEDCISWFDGDKGYDVSRHTKDQFTYSIAENSTNNTVYFFEPVFPGEQWAILSISYGGATASTRLISDINLIATRLNVKIIQEVC